MSIAQPTINPHSGPDTLNIPYTVWSAPGLKDDMHAPLLLVHDGPESDERSGLTKFLTKQVLDGALPVHRAALIEPVYGQRNNWYGASPEYNAAFTHTVLPAIVEAYPTSPKIIGMGASLGAVSMLGIAYENPGLLSGLFLQSGSFHHPKLDSEPGGYDEYDRVAAFVDATVHQEGRTDNPLDITLTCGRNEANLVGNIVMFNALQSQGHSVRFVDSIEGHSFESWGRLLNPHLRNFLRDAWNT